MRIRAIQLLKVEDFPDQKKWIGKLIQPLNDFLNQSIKIINDGIVFPDNFLGKDIVYSFTYQSEAITWPQKFQWPFLAKPKALLVVSATEDGVAFIPALSWQLAVDGTVQITGMVKFTSAPAVSLLTAGSKYEIRTRVTP